MPDKPFFMYFAPGAAHAPHQVPKQWIEKYQGRFDEGWDVLRERILARQKELGVVPPETELQRPPRRDPGLGRHARGAEADPRPADGGLRGLPRACRPPRRPRDRRARAARGPRGHARLLHRRRQRLQRGGHAQGHVQRAVRVQRRRPPGDARVPGLQDRRVRRPGRLQPLRRRMGARHRHAVSVDQAGRLALRRHPQRHDRPLAARVSRPGARSARSSTT